MSNPTEQDKRFLPYAPAPDPAAPPRTLRAIMADLSRDIHPDFLQSKEKGRTIIKFIEWYTAADILDIYAPGWQEDAVISMAGELCAVVVRIGIPTSDFGLVWRAADGQDEDEEKAYGEASNRAYSQAFRRAAAKFGLNRNQYRKQGRPNAHAAQQQVTGQTTGTPTGAQRPAAQAPPLRPAPQPPDRPEPPRRQPTVPTGSPLTARFVELLTAGGSDLATWDAARLAAQKPPWADLTPSQQTTVLDVFERRAKMHEVPA